MNSNGNEYSWQSYELRMNGVKITDIKGAKWADEVEGGEPVYGASRVPRGRTAGRVKTGPIAGLMPDTDALAGVIHDLATYTSLDNARFLLLVGADWPAIHAAGKGGAQTVEAPRLARKRRRHGQRGL